MIKPLKHKIPSKNAIKGSRAIGKVIPPKKGTSSGKVFTQEELRKEELKKNKKSTKGNMGYSGATRV